MEEDKVKKAVDKNLKKDKKALRIVLKILFLIAVAVVIISVCILVYKVVIVKKIMDNNVEVYLGNNYKIIKHRTYNNGSELDEVLYYKDGMVKHEFGGKNVAIKDKENVYMLSNDDKKYIEIKNDDSVAFTYSENANLLLNWLVDKNDVDSYFDVLKFIVVTGISVENEETDGKEYFVISFMSDKDNRWYINKENYYCEKVGQDTQKVEIGTVKDEDFVMPWELGYEKIEAITNNN